MMIIAHNHNDDNDDNDHNDARIIIIKSTVKFI